MINILLIGDSIRLDYDSDLKLFLPDDIVIHGKPGREEAYKNLDIPMGGNGGDSSMVLDYIRELDSQGKLNFDYFIFNCGQHDIKRYKPDNRIQIQPEEYAANLYEILKLMKSRNIKTIFINTTPADRSRYSEGCTIVRYNDDVIQYNAIAQQIMHEQGIPVIDLNAFVLSLGLEGDALLRDHAHYQPEIIKKQAAFLAEAICGVLAAKDSLQ